MYNKLGLGLLVILTLVSVIPNVSATSAQDIQWTATTIDNSGATTALGGAEIEQSGLATVLYWQTADDVIKFAIQDGAGGWTIRVVYDSANQIGGISSLGHFVSGETELWLVAFYDSTSTDTFWTQSTDDGLTWTAPAILSTVNAVGTWSIFDLDSWAMCCESGNLAFYTNDGGGAWANTSPCNSNQIIDTRAFRFFGGTTFEFYGRENSGGANHNKFSKQGTVNACTSFTGISNLDTRVYTGSTRAVLDDGWVVYDQCSTSGGNPEIHGIGTGSSTPSTILTGCSPAGDLEFARDDDIGIGAYWIGSYYGFFFTEDCCGAIGTDWSDDNLAEYPGMNHPKPLAIDVVGQNNSVMIFYHDTTISNHLRVLTTTTIIGGPQSSSTITDIGGGGFGGGGNQGACEANFLGINIPYIASAWDATETSIRWLLGILLLVLVVYGFAKIGAGAVMLGVAVVIGVGGAVAFCLFPVWLLLVIILLIALAVGSAFFGDSD